MPLTRIIFVSLFLLMLVFSALFYFSDKNISERKYNEMIEHGGNNIEIIKNYMSHLQHDLDWEYDQALRLAVSMDISYLDEIIDYYANGTFRLDTTTADIILKQLPSKSILINYVVGRIYSTNEFGHHNPVKSVIHLEFAALKGDKNAAEVLSQHYTHAECHIEAITWAKVANSRNLSSECTQLPIDVNLLTEQQWDAVLYNEDALDIAGKNNTMAKLKYSEQCSIAPKLH